MHDFHRLIALCQGRRAYIQTHNFPDPDAIASAYGLQKLLARFDIPATLCYDGRIDKLSASKMLTDCRIELFPYAEICGAMRADDAIICVDSQKNSGNITDFVGDEIACIDHHPTFATVDYAYREVQITGACATLIAQHYADLGVTPDADTATALLYGLKMDTLQFTRGVTEQDIAMFAFLFPLCDREKLARLERNNMEFDDLKAYGAAIERIVLYDRTGISSVPFSCPDAMIGILADFILSLNEVDVAIVYSHREDGIKFSVRSETPDIHAGELIHQALTGFGSGGGHAGMAGGLIRREQLPLLGNYPNDRIASLFLETLAKFTQRPAQAPADKP